MTTLFPNGSSSTSTHSSKSDAADFEPDEEWKRQLKARIQMGLQSLVQDAKDNQLAELRKAVVTPEERKRLDIEYKSAMASIKQLANDQYQAELEKERNQRRWIAGEPMLPGWSTYLKAEQEHIMNTIKQGGDQPASTASSEQPYSHPPSPQPPAPVTPATRTPEPCETPTPPSTLSSPHRKVRRRETEPSTTTAPSTADPGDPPHPQEREKPRSRQQIERRTSIASRDREEEPSPVGRRPNGSAHERPSNSWMSAEVVDEPEEAPNTSPSQTRYSSDKAPDRPWEGSLGRSSGSSVRSLTLSERGHTSRSPSNQPEVWKPTVNPADEPLALKPHANQVHRRGSTASMRSTGSGASIRPITETIPEREDGAEEGLNIRDWPHDPEKARKTIDKARDKEKRLARRDSRSTPVDITVSRHDEPLGLGGGMRSAGPSSATMQYATTSSSMKSLSNKSSFISTDERERYYQDRLSKQAYVDTRDQHYREPRYPAQDRELPRPPPPVRSPYGGDDRDYPPMNPPPPRPPPPRSPYNSDDREYRDLLASRPSSSRTYSGDDRDYHTPPPAVRSPVPPRSSYDDNYNNSYAPPITRHVNGVKSSFVDRDYGPPPAAHKGSFNYDDRRRDGWERPDREPLWDDDRDFRDREYTRAELDRNRDRELEWERDRDREREREPYPDTRGHPSHYAYGPPQHSGTYPTPVSVNRHGHPNGSLDYPPMGELYETREPPSRAFSYRDHHPQPTPPSQSAPPEEYDYEYQRQENVRSAPPTRQGSYSRRESGDRRLEDSDPYSRPGYPYSVGPRPPADEVSEKPVPAWRRWKRSPQDVKPPATAYARAPGPHARERQRGQLEPKLPAYHYDSLSEFEDPHYHSTDAGQETDSDSNAEDEEYEYDGDMDVFARSHQEPHDSGGPNDRNVGHRREDEEPETSDDEDVMERKEAERKLQQQAYELKRLEEHERHLEEETRRKEEEVRMKEAEVRKKEAEAARKADEARRKEEEAHRKAEEAQLREVEAQRKAEEARKMAEELKQKEEEAARKAEEARRIEEEAKRKAAEAKRKEVETKKKERDVNRREQEAKQQAAEAKKLEEEAKRKEDELKKKEEATRRKEEKLKQESEKTKILQQEAQKIADEALEKQEKLRQLEEEARRREIEIREREQALHIREEELKRREAEAKMKEDEAKRMEAEAQQKEAEMKQKEELERKLKEEAARREQARRAKEEAAKREEARLAEHTRLATEEAAKREEARIRAEQAAQEVWRRKQAAERSAREEIDRPFFDIDSFSSVNDLPDDLRDPKLMEEQAYIWQQLQYQQQADKIQQKRQEQRSRTDSLGTDTSWPYPPTGPSSQPAPSSSSRPPTFPQASLFTSPTPSERSTATSPSWNGTGSAWSSKSTSSATSATSATSSRTPNGTQPPKPSMNIPSQGKSRAGSFSSGTYPAGASPHSTPGTDEWQRRQAEFANAQQEKFRREQEKLEADMQMRSAGKPLSREDMQRVFERHERLWTQLTQKSDLNWHDFPWPMSKPPASPDDISSALVGAYMQSPCWPDKDKSKSTKDRIKEHMKRWHPDRFETKLLPKVVESEKDKVKQGAGNVARYLSDLLRKENENSSSSNIFGD